MSIRSRARRSLFFVLFLVSCLVPAYAESTDFPNLYGEDYNDYPGDTVYTTEEAETYDAMEAPYGEAPTEPEAPPPPPPVVPQPPVQLDQKSVLIGRPPYLSLKEMMRQVGGLFAFLRKEMGVKEVRLVTSEDYTSVLTALARGNIDFAWVGPMAYVMAREKNDLMPIAKAQHPGGAAYRGVFITRNDGRILGLDDVRGKTMGFVDPESASGYLYPLYVLKRLGIAPHKVCSKVYFLKKHDAILSAVLAGKIDVGVCLEATLESLADPKLRNQLLVLGKTDEVPSDVLVCRKDCPVNLRERFVEALLKRTASSSAPAAGSRWESFAPATDEDFQPVEKVWKAVRPLTLRP